MFPSLLIVDDETSILKSLTDLLSDEGFEVRSATNGYEAIKIIDSESPDLVLLDIWMPGMDGVETLKQIKKENPYIQVILITGHGNIETAVKATKLGAFDLIEKPLSIDKVIVAINNALNFRRLEEENRFLRKKTIEKHSITGNSPPIQELKKQISRVAPTEKWILVTGENGTGKELVARTIHQFSPRADQPFIDVNCAAIPEAAIDSELFGHEKGAFAGAASRKRGKLELANHGTLFLDEIADMNLKTQAKILRVLQEQNFQRVGGSRMLQVDVRIIAASNKDLEREIESGRFRKELFYRLNVIPIEVPPLRHRLDDLELLVETFFDGSARQSRSKPKSMSPAVLEILRGYTWPGNVRELKNLIERLSIMVDKMVIEKEDLPPLYRIDKPEKSIQLDRLLQIERWQDACSAFEHEYVKHKFFSFGQDYGKTAQALGVSPKYIQQKIKTA